MKACPNVDYFDALLLVRELQPRRPASMLPQCQRLGNLFILIFFFSEGDTKQKSADETLCSNRMPIFDSKYPYVRASIDCEFVSVFFSLLLFSFLAFSFLIFHCSRRVIAFCARIYR